MKISRKDFFKSLTGGLLALSAVAVGKGVESKPKVQGVEITGLDENWNNKQEEIKWTITSSPEFNTSSTTYPPIGSLRSLWHPVGNIMEVMTKDGWRLL